MNITTTPSTVIQPAARVCPSCSTSVNGFGPEGLCPACMLRAGLEAADDAVSTEVRSFQSHKLGGYELLEEIARGGMGVIYKARNLKLNRIVAVKMILGGQHAGVTDLARFKAEAETAARLQHPNVVAIHEVGECEGQPFFSMDFVAGQNLAQLVGNAPLPAKRAAIYLRQTAQAVHHAHQQGILHRDLKPSNVLIDAATDQPRVTDFGLAKRLKDDASLTMTGQVLGSPNFMSPEQAVGKQSDVGPTSDVYSLGAMLYHLLTGRPPFVADTVPATLRMVAEAEPISPRLLNASTPRDLETICLKCLQKEPLRRYATAMELAEDLGRFLRDEPIHARPAGSLEKGWRWCRRNRALAVVSGIVLALLLTVAIGSFIAAMRIEGEREKANANAKAEQHERERAEKLAEENRVNLYAARIKIAGQALKDSDASRAIEVLESLKPAPGQRDLRSFDWHYLRQRCQSERLAVYLSNRVFGVAFSPDGKAVAIANQDSIVRLINAENGEEIRRFLGHVGAVGAVAFSPDGKTIAATGADATICIWELDSTRLLQRLQADTNSLRTLAFSPDGNRLAALEGIVPVTSGNPFDRYAPNGSRGSIHIWQTKSYTLERTIPAHQSSAMSLAFSTDGTRLASGGQDGTVKLHDADTGRLLATQTGLMGNIFGLAFVNESRAIAVVNWVPYYESGELRLLKSDSLQEVRLVSGQIGKVVSISVSPQRDSIAIGTADNAVRIIELKTGKEVATYAGHAQPVFGLAFSPDGAVLVSGDWEGVVKTWGLKEDRTIQHIHTSCNYCVSFSPDGKLLANSGSCGVELRNADTGELLFSFPTGGGGDVMCGFTPDGSNILTAGIDGMVNIFDVEGRRSPRTIKAHNAKVWAFSVSPDGSKLATAGGLEDPTVRVWELATGKELSTLVGHQKSVTAVSFNRGGNRIFSGNWVETILWDSVTGEMLKKSPELAPRLAVSHDGKLIAASTYGKRIRLRDARTLDNQATLLGHKDEIYQVNFSHDDRLLVSASWDGTVKLWQVATGEELLTIPTKGGVAWSAAFSPDDRALAFSFNSNVKGNGVLTILRSGSRATNSGPR